MSQAVHDAARRSPLLDWSLVRRVLLIRLRSIGDTVLMTPCLSALKAWRPDVSVTVLSEPLAAPVLEDHPLVDNLVIVPPDLVSRARIVAELRRQRFDLAFNMHGGTTATIIARLSGARHTVGFRGYRHSWMLSERAPSPDVILGRATLHSVEQQLALINWAGVPAVSPRPNLSIAISADAVASARARLDAIGIHPSRIIQVENANPLGGRVLQSDFAVIAPTAAFQAKMWPVARFAGVIDHLRAKWDLPSVIIAGPGQEAIAREAAGAARAEAHVLTGLELKELIAVIGMARVFVGNDSGPMHIAAALNRPTVAIFGPSNPRVWQPWTQAPFRVMTNQGQSAADPWPGLSEVAAAVDAVIESALVAEQGKVS